MNRMGLFLAIIGIEAALWSSGAGAVDAVQVLGLLKDRVVLRIDGRQQTVKLGQQSTEGVRLIAVEANTAVLEINGVERRLGLSTTIGGVYKAPTQAEVRIIRDAQGMYKIDGTINGQRVPFLVDTGATVLALNATQARKLGIDYRYRGTRGAVVTASGPVIAYNIVLDQVGVGEISVNQVDAVVLEGNHPAEVLLGMSFLNRLTLENQGNLLILKRTY